MIKLARCCQTCAYANFGPRTNVSICKYYRDNNNYSLEVCKPFACEHWKDSRQAEKTAITVPSRNQSFWRGRIENLNRKLIKDLGV